MDGTFSREVFAKYNYLQCMECGHKAALLDERAFRCPRCRGLYDVEHGSNTSSLRSAEETIRTRWRKRAMLDYGGSNGPYDARVHSDVWAFAEMVAPQLLEKSRVTLGERIQFVPAGRNLRAWLGYDEDRTTPPVHIALEGLTPTGSFKDFGMAVLASVAKAAGATSLVCASTGDTSAAAAAYAAAAGLTCVVLLPEGRVSPVQLVQPLAFGAKILLVPGDFDACMAIMQELVASYGAYPANSINPARIEGHQATVFNAWQFLSGLPEWIVAPVGNGSNISSLGKGQRLLRELGWVTQGSRLLGCQAKAAAPLARSWKRAVAGRIAQRESAFEAWKAAYEPLKAQTTIASAQQIGAPVSAPKVMREIVASLGSMEWASDSEVLEAIRVCGSDGHFVCPQTGVALASLRKARHDGRVRADESVLIVSTAAGIKFPNVLDGEARKHTIRLPQASAAEAAKHIHQ